MARFLYVVARDRRDLYKRLIEEFAQDTDVGVTVDRRQGERRQHPASYAPERRRAERRTRPDLEAELRVIGSFIIRAT